MDFSIEKIAMLIKYIGKRQLREAVEVRNQEKIRKLGEKKTSNYLEYWKQTL